MHISSEYIIIKYIGFLSNLSNKKRCAIYNYISIHNQKKVGWRMALGKRNQKSNMSSHLQINGPKNMLESIDICTQVVHSEFIILQSKKKDLIWTAFIITSAHRCPMKMSPGRRLLYSAVRQRNNKMKSASAFWWHQVLGTVELASSWLFILFFLQTTINFRMLGTFRNDWSGADGAIVHAQGTHQKERTATTRSAAATPG